MKNDNVFSLLGLAARAGHVSKGTLAAKSSILRKKAHLLLMSTDIAVNTREELLAACFKTGVEWAQLGNRFELGQAVGKPYRVAVTVNDRGFAMAIKEQLERSGEIPNNGTGVVQ